MVCKKNKKRKEIKNERCNIHFYPIFYKEIQIELYK